MYLLFLEKRKMMWGIKADVLVLKNVACDLITLDIGGYVWGLVAQY